MCFFAQTCLRQNATNPGKVSKTLLTTTAMATRTEGFDLQDFAKDLESVEQSLLERFLSGKNYGSRVAVLRKYLF